MIIYVLTYNLQRAFQVTILFDPCNSPGKWDRADVIIPSEQMKKPRFREAERFVEGLPASQRSRDFRSSSGVLP